MHCASSGALAGALPCVHCRGMSLPPRLPPNGLVPAVLLAGWCACCKSSFPALCRIPTNDFMSQHFNFYKANIEVRAHVSLCVCQHGWLRWSQRGWVRFTHDVSLRPLLLPTSLGGPYAA